MTAGVKGPGFARASLESRALGAEAGDSTMEHLIATIMRTYGAPPPAYHPLIDVGPHRPPMELDFAYVAERIDLEVHGVTVYTRNKRKYGESLGTTQLYVDDRVVADGPMRTQTGHFTLCGDGLCIGFDSADKVSEEYETPGAFTNGTILGVAIDVSDEIYLDLEQEAVAALARD